MTAATALVTLAQAWGVVGLAVAAVFLLWGIDRIDPAARGAVAFRPLLVPGIVLLWPLVLWRWWRLARAPETAGRFDRPAPPRVHRRIWIGLAVVLPAILVVAAVIHQGPRDVAAVRIAPPPGEATGSPPGAPP
jgi:uncharacterized membrane protein